MKVLFTLFFVSSYLLSAQILINEYSCSNVNGPIDFFGDRNDWVEFYNGSNSAINIGGLFLSDKSSDLFKWEIPSGSIPANGHVIINFSGRDGVFGGEIHAGFGLTQTKNEWIILTAANGSVIDSLRMIKSTQTNHSYGRIIDGNNNWGIFFNPTYGTPNSNFINYYTPKPTFNIPSGFYNGPQNVTLTSANPNVLIRYTLNGNEPTATSTLYAGPIVVNATTVVRAKAFPVNSGTAASFIETNTYFINETHTVPVLSICGNEIQQFLDDNIAGAFTDNFKGAFEMFETNKLLVAEGEGDYNKHGNDSWAYNQRGFDFIMRDQYGHDYAIQHKIFQNKKRKKYKRVIVKAAANDNVSFEPGGAHIRDAYVHTLSQLGKLRMDERTSRFCILYVNGQYWGVYDIREKVDDVDFTEYYYDQKDIDFIKTWGNTWAEYGDLNHWTALFNYINSNSMSVQANYDYVDSLYNVGSLIDYVVMNSYTVCSDWLNWNTAWWHGHNPNGDKKKFRYALWDMDATFGHYINYTGVPSTSANADPCNPETLLTPFSDPQGHITILNKLMDNPVFKQAYISRYIDLSNTIFSCDRMITVLDSMASVIRPEMGRQVTKWGGSLAQWEANLATLKTFINDRCAAMSTGLINCYSLSGPFTITLDVDPPNSGQIKVNSEYIPYYSFQGIYYGGIETYLKAKAKSGYNFDRWEASIHSFADPMIDQDTLEFMMDDTIIAYFMAKEVIEPIDTTTNPSGLTGFHVPTGFSPDNDGINDVYKFYVGNDVASFNLRIFDRWGAEIFHTDSFVGEWDGSYQGKFVNAGVYAYGLTYTLKTGQEVKKSGNITIIR
ncbi:MAG: CotH kinase family protein [Crocinitomicaceae bacterium]